MEINEIYTYCEQDLFILYNFSINGLKMVDLLELGRKGKRSLDGNISYRKAGLLVFIILGRFTNHKQEIFRGVYSLDKSPPSPF